MSWFLSGSPSPGALWAFGRGDQGERAFSISDIIQQAKVLARNLDFSRCCLPETGRLLQTLVASSPTGRIAELGAGCGYGSAWIASGLAPRASFVTVDIEPSYAGAVRALLTPYANIRVIEGDWREALASPPFDLIFADVSEAKLDAANLVVEALAPGGMAVLDDLTPVEQWPDEWRGKPDPLRDFWLTDERLTAAEIAVTPHHAVILATRRHSGTVEPAG